MCYFTRYGFCSLCPKQGQTDFVCICPNNCACMIDLICVMYFLLCPKQGSKVEERYLCYGFFFVLNRVRVSTSHLLPYTQILVKYPPLQVTNEWHIQILLFDLFWFSGDDVPAHLYGKTEFGDNVDNEWFIVSLLLQLSKVFPETCIRWDNYTLSGIYNSNET